MTYPRRAADLDQATSVMLLHSSLTRTLPEPRVKAILRSKQVIRRATGYYAQPCRHDCVV